MVLRAWIALADVETWGTELGGCCLKWRAWGHGIAEGQVLQAHTGGDQSFLWWATPLQWKMFWYSDPTDNPSSISWTECSLSIYVLCHQELKKPGVGSTREGWGKLSSPSWAGWWCQYCYPGLLRACWAADTESSSLQEQSKSSLLPWPKPHWPSSTWCPCSCLIQHRCWFFHCYY